MEKVIECPCGYLIRAAVEKDLVSQAQKHAISAHDMVLTEEEALAMARPD
jgi:predicted small metal-binding protein